LKSGKKSTADAVYQNTVDQKTVNDRFGNGKQLILVSRDREKMLDFRIACTLYDSLHAVFIDVACQNVSGKPVIISSIEPVCAIAEIGASLHWPSAATVLTNGPMYYDAGMIHHLGDDYKEPQPYGPIKGGYLSPEFPYPSPKRIRSWWNAGLFGGYHQEGLVCGFIRNSTGLGQLILGQNGSGGLSLFTESVFAEGTELGPGQMISAGTFVFHVAPDPYAALEGYADIMGIANNSRHHSIVNGWCGWFYTYEWITEEEVLRNAADAARYLKPFGLEYVQIDEGFQRYHGEWEGNERFPHGMKWLADRIKDFGLKPGIWLAPFIISEPTEVFRKHPDWLLKNADGEPMRVGPWPSEESEWAKNEQPKRYCLDISHPEAQKWLYNLLDTVANRWGYEMFKIDFVAWSILSAKRYHDTAFTPAKAYRKGMQIIRDAVGPEKHINDCGPGPVTVGLIDSMRIELDQNYGFSDAAWKQYFLDSSSSAPAAAKRYGFHQRTWINDADHVCMQLLSLPQAQAAATLIALSGGNVISGDRLTDLDPSRREILRKILPSCGDAARPVDLLDSDRHSIFALRIRKPFGEWTIVGCFNPGLTETAMKTIPLDRLGLIPAKTFIAYDFWMERLFGEITGRLELTVQPGSVTLLALHEKKSVPQVISTDRHVLQGAFETEDVQWIDATGTLQGMSAGVRNSAYNVMVYCPEEIRWHQDRRSLHQDFDHYTVKPVGSHLLRVRLKFGDLEKIRWEVRFKHHAGLGAE
jgi:alpha-galactosidase